MTAKKIAVIIGSLRKESFNRKTAKALIQLAPDSLKLEIVEINELSLYNEDIENTPPKAWISFREKLKTFDGVIFVTPEYNRSVPAVIKNAIDIASRPYGQNVWDGKPGAVISVSQGNLGGFGANHHLRQSLVFLNVPVMQQPEAYIGSAAGLFDNDGSLINESAKNFMKKFIDAFAQWVYKNSRQ
ncbi:MAG: NAD(P)H-dependent oxidoreductase [Endomicrobiaceae bacterium]|jgi:chromate reductase|nr:NAD(P)H-dependent oxidoreductase [Endomicrobiaceae bacterium]